MVFKSSKQSFTKKINGSEEEFIVYAFDVSCIYDVDDIDIIEIRKKQKEWLLDCIQNTECFKSKYSILTFESSLTYKSRVRNYYGYWKKRKQLESLEFLSEMQESKIQAENQESFYGVADFHIQDIGKALEFIIKENGIILGSNNGIDIKHVSGLFSIYRNCMLELDEQALFEWAVSEKGAFIRFSEDGEGELIRVYIKN